MRRGSTDKEALAMVGGEKKVPDPVGFNRTECGKEQGVKVENEHQEAASILLDPCFVPQAGGMEIGDHQGRQ